MDNDIEEDMEESDALEPVPPAHIPSKTSHMPWSRYLALRMEGKSAYEATIEARLEKGELARLRKDIPGAVVIEAVAVAVGHSGDTTALASQILAGTRIDAAVQLVQELRRNTAKPSERISAARTILYEEQRVKGGATQVQVNILSQFGIEAPPRASE
jgi:predicted ribonuclease toxin of YeeF-YezG toxin-antitoxin module